jgi:hypothetical protein
VKYTKWHTLVFKCPSCGDETDYALHVDEGVERGSPWDPTYWCAHCERPARVRDPWLFGLVYGPLMAMIAAPLCRALLRRNRLAGESHALASSPRLGAAPPAQRRRARPPVVTFIRPVRSHGLFRCSAAA